MKILNYRVKSQEDIKSICKYFNISTEQFNLNNTCKSVEKGSVVKILLKQKNIAVSRYFSYSSIGRSPTAFWTLFNVALATTEARFAPSAKT